jgi:hypothetical protein
VLIIGRCASRPGAQTVNYFFVNVHCNIC